MVRKLIPIFFQGREAGGNLRRFGLDIDKGQLTAEVGSWKLCMEDATEFQFPGSEDAIRGTPA